MPKKLYKDHRNRMLMGVCAGIAKYFNVDPTLVRVIWVIVSMFGGAGILAYILCALIIPENPC